MLNTALLAFSFGMLGAGGFAALSAIDIQRAAYRPPSAEAAYAASTGEDTRQIYFASMR